MAGPNLKSARERDAFASNRTHGVLEKRDVFG
jgi:hypothetical protein